MVNTIFLQAEDFAPEKASGLKNILECKDDALSLFYPQIVASSDDAGRVYEDDRFLSAIKDYIEKNECRIILIEDSPYSRPFAVKLAMSLNAECFISVKHICLDGEKMAIQSLSFQTNMIMTRTEKFRPFIAAINPDDLTVSENRESRMKTDFDIHIEKIEAILPEISGNIISEKEDASVLKKAKLIFACGSGIGSKENVERVKRIAEKFGGTAAGTRPVVANGWLPAEYLIGISGSSVSPDVAVVIGASGSQAFMAGISSAKKIISVNKDKSAPIFRNSDVGIICDADEFIEFLGKE